MLHRGIGDFLFFLFPAARGAVVALGCGGGHTADDGFRIAVDARLLFPSMLALHQFSDDHPVAAVADFLSGYRRGGRVGRLDHEKTLEMADRGGVVADVDGKFLADLPV